MNLESSILQNIRLAAAPSVLWRNNSGSYMKDGYFIRYGVGQPGGSDLIGFTPRLIGEGDVGTELPIFTAIEVKTKTGRISPEQQNFIDVIRRAGGIAGVARSPEEARKIIRGY